MRRDSNVMPASLGGDAIKTGFDPLYIPKAGQKAKIKK